MRLLYDALFLLFVLLYMPVFLFDLLFRKKYRKSFRARLGAVPLLPAGKRVWLHAVSVGELMAARPLIEQLKTAHPDAHLVISTTTETGQSVALKSASGKDTVIYFPFDFSPITNSVVRRINPALFVLMETELWPNMINSLHVNATPVVLANGRISNRSFARYRAVRPLLKKALSQVSFFFMQTAEDMRRICALGADPRKVIVAGNTKFDATCPPEGYKAATGKLKKEMGISDDDAVIVAGSTHEGEEKILLQVFLRLLPRVPAMKLVLVPRHPERCRAVEELILSLGLKCLRLSVAEKAAQAAGTGSPPVLLIDRVGYLFGLYSIATVAYVGGSLVPHGGHNPIEPAMFSKPIVTGPHVHNFEEIYELFTDAGAVFPVSDGNELEFALENLLTTKALRGKAGEKARAVVDSNRGASSRIIQGISPFIAS